METVPTNFSLVPIRSRTRFFLAVQSMGTSAFAMAVPKWAWRKIIPIGLSRRMGIVFKTKSVIQKNATTHSHMASDIRVRGDTLGYLEQRAALGRITNQRKRAGR